MLVEAPLAAGWSRYKTVLHRIERRDLSLVYHALHET